MVDRGGVGGTLTPQMPAEADTMMDWWYRANSNARHSSDGWFLYERRPPDCFAMLTGLCQDVVAREAVDADFAAVLEVPLAKP